MSEYNDLGPVMPSGQADAAKKHETKESPKQGDRVRVFAPGRNNPNEHTVYVFEALVDTPEGQRAKLSFKAAGGKTFYRIAHPDDLLPE